MADLPGGLWLALARLRCCLTAGEWPLRSIFPAHAPKRIARLRLGLLIGVLFGLEAASLRRWTYRRRRWTNIGVVVGDDEEDAERRFLGAGVQRDADRCAGARNIRRRLHACRLRPCRRVTPLRNNYVIGLFPQPGRRS